VVRRWTTIEGLDLLSVDDVLDWNDVLESVARAEAVRAPAPPR